jgi:predicted nucleic acid-binding Zn finger protein
MSSESVQPEVDSRTLRAITEYMTVVEEARALFEVTTQSGSAYMVDLREGVCSCPDYRNREPEGGCKHLIRTRAEVSQIDLDALEAELERTASDLETDAEQLERQAQDLHDEASSLKNAIDRLQEVRL